MWQQAFRDQIKAAQLSPMQKVVLLDLADQLYSTTWQAQRGCSFRDIGKRCACSKATAHRAVRAAIAAGHITKKSGKCEQHCSDLGHLHHRHRRAALWHLCAT